MFGRRAFPSLRRAVRVRLRHPRAAVAARRVRRTPARAGGAAPAPSESRVFPQIAWKTVRKTSPKSRQGLVNMRPNSCMLKVMCNPIPHGLCIHEADAV